VKVIVGKKCDCCGWFGSISQMLLIHWPDAGICITPEWNCFGCAAWYQSIAKPWAYW
jgi:hypothetical protein